MHHLHLHYQNGGVPQVGDRIKIRIPKVSRQFGVDLFFPEVEGVVVPYYLDDRGRDTGLLNPQRLVKVRLGEPVVWSVVEQEDQVTRRVRKVLLNHNGLPVPEDPPATFRFGSRLDKRVEGMYQLVGLSALPNLLVLIEREVVTAAGSL